MTVLYTDVNKDDKTMVVHVGVNLHTINTADQLQGHLERRLDKAGNGSSTAPATPPPDGTGRIVKRSKNYDDF
jgi:hypothetical protein